MDALQELAARWHVLRFTWRQVTREPDMVAAAIRRTLEALQAA